VLQVVYISLFFSVASHEKENEMSIHNLAIVFGPTLLESQSEGDNNKYLGQTSQEIGCVEDLLQYYAFLFDVRKNPLSSAVRAGDEGGGAAATPSINFFGKID